MTDRQFVLKKFPNATLDYKVCVVNRQIWSYRILSDNFFNANCIVLSVARDARTAWRKAKKKILNEVIV